MYAGRAATLEEIRKIEAQLKDQLDALFIPGPQSDAEEAKEMSRASFRTAFGLIYRHVMSVSDDFFSKA